MVSAKEESLSFIALKGQQGLSEFRLKALLELIREDFSQIQAINCEDFCHNLKLFLDIVLLNSF